MESYTASYGRTYELPFLSNSKLYTQTVNVKQEFLSRTPYQRNTEPSPIAQVAFIRGST